MTCSKSAANCVDTTIPFLSSVELSHFHIWAAAVQPDSPDFQADAERMKRALEVRCCTYMHKPGRGDTSSSHRQADIFADAGLMQKLAAAYVAQLFPVETVAADTDVLRVCPLPHLLTLRRMHASEQCSGQTHAPLVYESLTLALTAYCRRWRA